MNTGKPSPIRNPHLQRRAIKLLGAGHSMADVASDIGVNLYTLASWVQRYEDQCGPIVGRHRYSDVPPGTFDGTSCERCGLRNPHVCLPERVA